jgi:hypothetical protein
MTSTTSLVYSAIIPPMNSRCCVAVFLLLLVPSGAIGQVANASQAWLGVWKLNPQQSTFDERAPIVARAQTLTIGSTSDALTLAATTTLREGRRVSEAASVNLNGKPTIGPVDVVTVFKAIDLSTFEILVTLTGPASGEVTGVNRFVFSPDGRSLVETKTQTRRTPPSAGQAPPQESEPGTITSVLIFERQE